MVEIYEPNDRRRKKRWIRNYITNQNRIDIYYNLDVFEYESESLLIVRIHPDVARARSKNANGAGRRRGGEETISSGMYFHNPTETYVDIVKEESSLDERTPHWMAESGADLFCSGLDFASIHKMYGDFLGTTALPPLFSLGIPVSLELSGRA